MTSAVHEVEIFCDGACRGNPGPGGWGAILRSASGKEKELSGYKAHTTNNEMELTAAIEGLRALKKVQRQGGHRLQLCGPGHDLVDS